MKATPSRPVLLCLAYVLLHFATHFSAKYFEVSPGISLWYPPAALALALMIIQGPRMAPLVLATNFVCALFSTSIHSWWSPILFPLLITANYAFIAWLARQLKRPDFNDSGTRNTALYTGLMALAPVGVALSGCLCLLLTGDMTWSEFPKNFVLWWMGDVGGILCLLPAILVFVPNWLDEKEEGQWGRLLKDQWPAFLLEGSALLFSLFLVMAIRPLREANAFYLTFLPLIWICTRRGLPGATLAMIAVTMAGLLGMHIFGSTRDLLVHFVLFEGSTALLGLGLGSAVSRRQKAEEERQHLLQVMEVSTDLMATTAANGAILYANQAFLRESGARPSQLGTGMSVVTDYFNESERNFLQRQAMPAALKGESWHGELQMQTFSGMRKPMSVVILAHPHQKLGGALTFIMRDISRQRQAESERIENERRMLQVQKLESLGALAGGIAHDFNNLLTVVLGHANLSKLELPAESTVQQSLTEIEKAASSAAELCQQMLAYAGKSPLSFSRIDLGKLIQDNQQLLRASISKKHLLDLQLGASSNLVQADASQLRQAILNLVLNGSEAIGDHEGVISIRCGLRILTEEELRRDYSQAGTQPGPFIVIEVRDSGKGMSPETLARIFEPFYTTKFMGHGLGLAAVHGIVQSHGGGIHVSSTPGRGSIFRIALPQAQDSLNIRETAEQLSNWKGSGLVLVVDDEDTVRNIVSKTLSSLGFTPVIAADGFEGVEKFRQNASELRYVLLDLTMPRMDGERAFHVMHTINPEIPIVLMSGFSEKLSLQRFADNQPASFMAKPFDRRALASCLRRLEKSQPEKVN